MAGRSVARTVRIRPPADAKETRELLYRYREAGCVQVALDFGEADTLAGFLKRAEAVMTDPL